MHRTELESGVVFNVHHPLNCEGEVCTIHNRTEHSLRQFAQVFNERDGHIYRVCRHLNFFLDPDEVSVPRNYIAPDCACL